MDPGVNPPPRIGDPLWVDKKIVIQTLKEVIYRSYLKERMLVFIRLRFARHGRTEKNRGGAELPGIAG